MIHAGDQWVQLPVRDLYDSQIMALSIQAAKDMYEKGQKQIEDFYTKYGDFTSPIQKDMDWYNANVTGKARDVINNLYANGIDPLRSAEGRAAVSQLIYSMPVGDIAKLRQSAETAKEYLRSFDESTNPELEKFLGRDLSAWSTLGDASAGVKANGVWGYNKATRYQDLNEFTGHIFDKMQDEYIPTDGKDGYDYYGVTRERRAKALTDQIGGILNSDLGRFHYAQSKASLEKMLERPVSDAEAMEAFKNDILTSTTEYERRNRVENKEYARQRDFYYDNKLDAAKKARDYYYESVKPFDLDDDGKLDDNEKQLRKQYKTAAVTGGGKEKDDTPNIFRESEAYAKYIFENKPAGYKNVAGLHVSYEPGEQYFQKIDPVIQSDSYISMDKDTGEKWEVFKFRKKDIIKKGSVYNMWDDGSMHPLSWTKGRNVMSTEFKFTPDGNMRSVYDGISYKHYISGTMYGNNDGDLPVFGGKRVWIQVKERGNNYGQTQKKH